MNLNHLSRILNNENYYLKFTSIVLMVISILYVGMMMFTISASPQSFQGYLESNIQATIEFLSVSILIIGAYIINEYRKNTKSRYLYLSLLTILGSQLLQMNYLSIGLILFYLIKFVNVESIFKQLRELNNKSGLNLLLISIFCLIVSSLILYLNLVI